MKTTHLIPLGLALVSSALAQVVNYADVNMSLPGSSGQTLLETTPLSLDPDHSFIDPDVDNPTLIRYYGGTLTYTGNAGWGGSAQIYFTNESAPNSTGFNLQIGGGSTVWNFLGNGPSNNTGISSGTFDFVIKIEDVAYNQAIVKLFLGANATSATEGTPDLTMNSSTSTSVIMANLTTMSFRLSGESWEATGQTLTAENLFSSTEWNPVGASNIPEPSAAAMLVGLVALGLVSCRRRRSAA